MSRMLLICYVCAGLGLYKFFGKNDCRRDSMKLDDQLRNFSDLTSEIGCREILSEHESEEGRI